MFCMMAISSTRRRMAVRYIACQHRAVCGGSSSSSSSLFNDESAPYGLFIVR